MSTPRFVLLAAVAFAASGCGASSKHAATTTQRVVKPDPVAQAVPVTVGEHRLGNLAAPVQDATSAPWRGGVILAGGLTAADTSTSNVVLVRAPGSAPPLPLALHDATSAALGDAVYLFGGGDGVHQLDGIIRVTPGAPATVAHLPAPSSDQAGAAWGGAEYVVGGYTGSRWLNTIVRWRPGRPARVVGHLPVALRYAAVASVSGRIVIAGGSTPAGTASDAVLSFDPATGRVTRIGRLPSPTTHAAAAVIGDRVYVIGGRGATVDTPTAAIEAVDPIARKVVPAGLLDSARSDLAGASVSRAGSCSRAAVALPGQSRPSPSSRPTRRTTSAVPKLVDAHNVYAADRPGNLTGAARRARPLVYVPNSQSNTVDVIDPHTFKIVDHFAVGGLPQHVVPAYDLAHLYVTNDTGNTLTEIDPRTGAPAPTIPVDDPYNMYFTPDGRYAIVVAERNARFDFRDAQTFALVKSVSTPCRGVDHMDFTADGTKALVSCEFSGQLLELDVARSASCSVFAAGGGARHAPGREAVAGRSGLLRRRHDRERRVDRRARRASASSRLRPRPVAARTASIRAGTRVTCMSRIAAPARSRCSASRRARSCAPGGSRAVAAPTWAASPPTARCSGCRAATAAWSTRSRRATGSCSPRIPVGAGPHGPAVSGHSRAATHSGTRASCVRALGEELQQQRVQLLGLLHADQVTGARDERQIGVRDLFGEVLRRSRRKSVLVVAHRRPRVSASASVESGAISGHSTSGSSCAVCSSSARRCCGRTSSRCSRRDPELQVDLGRGVEIARTRSPPPRAAKYVAHLLRPSQAGRPAATSTSRSTSSWWASAVRSATAPPNELPTSAAGRMLAATKSTSENGSVGSGVGAPAGQIGGDHVEVGHGAPSTWRSPETGVAERRVQEHELGASASILHHVTSWVRSTAGGSVPAAAVVSCRWRITSRARRAASEYWANAVPGVQGILERDGRVLLARRGVEPRRGYWDLPGASCTRRQSARSTGCGASSTRRRASTIEPVRLLRIDIEPYGGRLRVLGHVARPRRRRPGRPPTTSPNCAGSRPASSGRDGLPGTRTSCSRDWASLSGAGVAERPPWALRCPKMGRSAHARIRGTADHRAHGRQRHSPSGSRTISPRPGSSDLARDGVDAIEQLPREAPGVPDVPRRSLGREAGLDGGAARRLAPARAPSRASPSASRRRRRPVARRPRTAP